MSDQRPAAAATVAKLMLHCLLGGVLAAALMFPIVGGAGLVANRLSEVVAQDSAQLVEGEVPIVSTMVDAAGNPIAWLYTQRRWEVPGDRIADTMKLAIVSIEDKRFAEHNGVDVQGTLTGLAGLPARFGRHPGRFDDRAAVRQELQPAGERPDRRGAAGGGRDHAGAQAARDPDGARARQGALQAGDPDSLSEPGAVRQRRYGVQEAAKTYFGVDAAQLKWHQAALLAGMVQSSSALNPYTNPEGALARRNLVLDTMIENLPDTRRRTPCRQGAAAGRSASGQTRCSRAASPRAIAPSSAITRCPTSRARESTRSRWRATAT